MAAIATVRPDGTGSVVIDDETERLVTAGSVVEARRACLTLVIEHARRTNEVISLEAHESEGQVFALLVHPDGLVTTNPTPATPVPPPAPAPAAQPSPFVASPSPSSAGLLDSPPVVARRARENSFLRSENQPAPATQGWRGAMGRVGIRMPPSHQELTERAAVSMVSRHWPGPRTIAIVNGKGGAGKTPTTALLAAAFARHGGAGVLAWDNNQTRGTLGWRTEQGPHDGTLLELLPATGKLLSTQAQAADLAHYVHHQTEDRYDVLRSKPMELASAQRISADDVDAIHRVACKYYRLVLMDSGNDESDPMWRRMIHHTDQLVMATTTRDDHAESGALLLESLAAQGDHGARLAEQAAVIINQADPTAHRRDVDRVVSGFREIARSVSTIPFDPAMVDGRLRWDALRPGTRLAWLQAAARVAQGL